ncbi:heavy metal translocating P-type ATPase [Lactiplantibacillus plantarum]|jgi:Zn2+/Cd2+-exporting ATPase|uniref:heavy metal translocating P-type ATPase n=1 Tax=Lactiplantibacillus plantarum TaxID=1590 RepID=UPI0007EE4603|nr:heavy metal translocating P-type ATPase [Lactiplantibacillus plantarum]MCM8649798.1 heavy metal translocating P-type ATPase [Lactiplantibacillus sp. E932]MCG0630416.1 cadmium transporting P-type ATPase [Lactiplantibacillus plantarum]MCT1242503.1 copper-translocating P-type ATPase [Lactiplantibacillus plantarum]MCW6133089.1 heavy metal translocating P-type ATPase [Lactiplantibacillus plantarum]MDO7547142.1 heavy metal translocating P-type ATPase [Lactiplantibacillus plantarum]
MKFQLFLTKHTNQITLVTGILIVLGMLSKYLLQFTLGYQVILAVASIIAVIPIAVRAWSALRNKVFSIELLVSIAVIGAFIIGEFNESAIVTFLFLFGSYLESKTLQKTRTAIKGLTDMSPTTATLVTDDGTEEVDVDDVDEGDVVLVKTGSQVPVDGIVVEGNGYLNEASITGEARQINKQLDDSVYSGTMVENGYLKIKATQVGDDTTFAKIIELVEEAQDTKSKAEKFIDRFAQYYTPAVLVLAALVFAFSRDFRLAITVLVLGCPGALVIGAPVSNVAGIGNGAKRGILIKGGEVVDTFAKVDTLVFDKTGTLTEGNTAVTTMHTYTNNADNQLALAAAIEGVSDHPLGQAIVSYADQQSAGVAPVLDDTETVKGQGICAQVGQQEVVIGNQKMLTAHNIKLNPTQLKDLNDLQAGGQSTVIMAVDGQVQLIFGIADTIRPGVKDSLAALKAQGIKKLVMLTGDNELTAQAVANELNLDEVHANLLPEEKVEYVKKLKAAGNTVAFIGDGINDSPSIANADIGIAMGSGTDVAIDTSDVVLMQSSFPALVHAHGLAKKTVLNTRENIFIAIATVAFLLIGLIFGYIYMASGMFVHEASILVVIFNAMRLINFQTKFDKHQPTKTIQAATA